MAAVEKNKQTSIDSETLTRVAREVIARLGQASSGQPSLENTTSSLENPTSSLENPTSRAVSKTNRTAVSTDERVITTSTISRLPSGTAELFVPAAAVVTPSARDEARTRGISINHGSKVPTSKNHSQTPSQVIDFADPARAAAVAQQLSRRAIASSGTKIILSDTPARDLYHQCTRHGEVAVMVGSIDEVQRFASELDATAWVLDMKRLNLTAAVNVAAHISRIGRSQS